MTKLSVIAYPAIAVISLAAAFTAQAQSMNDMADQAGYGPTPGMVTSGAPAAKARVSGPTASRVSLIVRTVTDTDPIDHAAYGATPSNGLSLRTRAEVRAEAVAARDAGLEATWREGGDPQYAILQRAKTMDTAHVLAAAPAKPAQ